MSGLVDILRAAKQSGDFGPLAAAMPYAAFMGFSFEAQGDEVRTVMRYRDDLIGNASLPALHGGTVGALLETAAILELLFRAQTVLLPKTITITVDYLRPGRPLDTFARARITRHGRRVVNVAAEAWQDDPTRPIAMANALFLVKPE